MASENFYNGSIYSTDPAYKIKNPYFTPTGYQANFASLSMALDPRTANQLKEVNETLNTGIKNIEVGNVDPSIFESIPKEHFTEMRRAAKLAGKSTELTFHAPMVDPTGITQQGWDVTTQKAAEEQLWSSLEKAHELNPKGNVVATFHATSVPLPPAEQKVKFMNEETGKEEERVVSQLIINKATGKIEQIKESEKFFGGKTEGPIPFNADKERNERNRDIWMSQMDSLNFSTDRGQQELRHAEAQLNELPKPGSSPEDIEKWKKIHKDRDIDKELQRAKDDLDSGGIYLYNAFRSSKQLFDLIYKNAEPEDQQKLRAFEKEIKPYEEKWEAGKLTSREQLDLFADTLKKGINKMKDMKPKIYTPLREFAIEKSAETTANLALRGFKEFKDSAPIIAIENHPAFQSVLTTGQDLKDVVNLARKDFVKKAKEAGLSESEAKEQAEKLIGVTWDVGHINMIRRHGYGEKELIEETKAVGPFVKKIHLADNFGFEHTELPMGMGNVPMDKIMKAIGKEGYDIKKVIEAGNWWQHFAGQQGKAAGPLIATLGGMGVPVYPSAYGPSPSWNQVYGNVGPYFAGYGTMLPDMNFQTYGAGFSSLPMELGGQIAGKESKFSGTPMA